MKTDNGLLWCCQHWHTKLDKLEVIAIHFQSTWKEDEDSNDKSESICCRFCGRTTKSNRRNVHSWSTFLFLELFILTHIFTNPLEVNELEQELFESDHSWKHVWDCCHILMLPVIYLVSILNRDKDKLKSSSVFSQLPFIDWAITSCQHYSNEQPPKTRRYDGMFI